MEMIDTAPYRALWTSVLYQAVRDADNEIIRGRKGPGFYWIFSDRKDVGSMRWICDMVDLDYHKLQLLCTTRSGRAKILKRGKKDREFAEIG